MNMPMMPWILWNGVFGVAIYFIIYFAVRRAIIDANRDSR
jgi:hypothetical protein